MKEKKWLDTGVLILTIGGIILAILGVKSFIDEIIKIPKFVYSILFIVSMVMVILGLLKIYQFYRAGLTTTFIEFERKNLQYSELSDIHKFCVDELGDDVADIKTFQKFHKKNNKIFSIVTQTKVSGFSKNNKLIGFYDILPVNEHAARLLDREEIKGASILPENITEVNTIPYAIYIGGIAAIGFTGKGQTLSFLKQEIQEYVNDGVKVLYTRPVSNRGLTLVTNYGFVPVSEEVSNELSRIYKKIIA